MYKAILFDLDGTLLPIDNESFFKIYFTELTRVLVSAGIEQELAVKSVWAGTKAMIMNDGKRYNKDVFWETFVATAGCKSAESFINATDPFYNGDFHKIRAALGENPYALRAVELAARNGRRVVLATNPVFPPMAQLARLSWIGLSGKNFDLITDYESDRFCKPNPKYYLSICERIGVEPSECLMVGNDESDDMMGASAAGLDCFLVTDYLIPSEKFKWTGERGTFAELIEKLEAL